MTVGLIGDGTVVKEELVETDDESTVGFEAECEAFTTLKDGTGTYLLSYGNSGGSGGKASTLVTKCDSLIQGPATILPTIRQSW